MAKYFTMYELLRSKTAIEKKIENKPTIAIEDNLRALIENVLDPLREKYGKPITVTSGYRCAAINKAAAGSATSQHLYGEAADITTGSKEENRKLAKLIAASGKFDQMIDEYNYSWIHVSYKRIGTNRHEIRRTKDGKSYPIIKAENL